MNNLEEYAFYVLHDKLFSNFNTLLRADHYHWSYGILFQLENLCFLLETSLP